MPIPPPLFRVLHLLLIQDSVSDGAVPKNFKQLQAALTFDLLFFLGRRRDFSDGERQVIHHGDGLT